jgi:ABC-type thiamine transport system ATPase subunit
MTGIPAYRRPVNMVFQHYALFPHLSVGDNVSYGLRQRNPRPSRAELAREVTEALAMVRLEGYENRRSYELSGGQQQRVALARALINRPAVLLLDEPLAALDRKLRRDMQIELQNLQRDVGITFLLVTHDQEEALSMSDRVCVMRDGRIVQTGSPRELYDRPVNRYVADFVGRARAVNPDVDVVVGALPQVWIERVPAYNALLPQVAAELSTPESRVVVTPVADFTRGVETFDDAHPTLLGMRKIAASVSAGLEQLGIGRTVLMPEPGGEEPPAPSPEPTPSIPTPTPPPVEDVVPPVVVTPAPTMPSLSEPGAPRRVRAGRHGRRTTVTWRLVETADQYTVKCGRVRRAAEGRRAVLRVTARRCSVRAVNDAGAGDWTRVTVRVRQHRSPSR